MSGLRILSCGPGLSIQDMGRPGYLEQGLSISGVADQLALHEAGTLLGHPKPQAVIEMAGIGGAFKAETDMTIALTGAIMKVSINGAQVAWNATYFLPRGADLKIGGVQSGVYGYLSFGAGISTKPFLGSRSIHLRGGIGQALQAGELIPLGRNNANEAGIGLDAEERFSGGVIRIIPSVQSALFPQREHKRFSETIFIRSLRGNRMGVAFDFKGDGFAAEGQLSILSEIIAVGDIQMTGDGRPFVLLPECQTTGGYPRIGTVIPADLPKLAQTAPGKEVSFQMITLPEALDLQKSFEDDIKRLSERVSPLIRDPSTMNDLLSYQLISGAISANSTAEET
ncbi:MAG: urea amidolyase [Paracoccaceae bacterium]|nr:urea amidolyase [Paracoccaceae bacterium]